MRTLLSILGSIFLILPHAMNAQFQYTAGLDFDDAGYGAVKRKANLTRSLDVLPVNASIKMYAPIPKSQGSHGTCAAWATAYCGRTIVEAVKNEWTNKQFITDRAYSPAFLFRLLKPADSVCTGGSSLGVAFDLMKEKGSIPFNRLSVQCTPAIPASLMDIAGKEKIKDYLRLFDMDATPKAKIDAVKKSIAEKKPVVFGMICLPSFQRAVGVWIPTEQPNESMGGHGMCVVGYDDNEQGGVFEIQNSWGTTWGNEGYIKIKYEDFARFTRYAFEFIDLPIPKPAIPDLSGKISFSLDNGNTMPINLLMSTRGLSVVPAVTAPGPLTMYKTVGKYSSGTRFKIYISNNEPAYVYAFSTDLTNQISRLFPYNDSISAALTDKKTI